jgi:hypothetical protein
MESARVVVRTVVAELLRRLADRTRAAVTGALDRSARTRRPRPADIDLARTIRANLQHFSPDLGTIVPERLIGHGRRRRSVQRDVILAVDQSGSMAESVVYAGLFGAVLASMPALQTRFVAFDTAVADLTDELGDPVELLFGTQLGGGTDINRAIAYCQSLVARPTETLLVLISDLYEGGSRADLLRRVGALVAAGVQVVTARPVRLRRTRLRPRQRRRTGRAGRPGVRLHPGAVPRPDGGRDPRRGPGAVVGHGARVTAPSLLDPPPDRW